MAYSPSSTGSVRSRPHGPRGPKLNPRSPPSVVDLTERLQHEEEIPAYSSPRSTTSLLPRTAAPMYSTQVSPAMIPSSRPYAESSSVPRSSAPAHSVPAVKIIPKRPALPAPPSLNFDSSSVKWQGMPLEVAQWTMTSEELQAVVSEAIKKSAEESFIRLVPKPTLDGELGAELDRLESLRATTQSQYRFNMHRRTMLLQSLNALSQSEGDSNDALFNLTTQLAEISVSNDRLTETLLQAADQRAQIQRLQDVHIGSALAMALRKLNSSYAKRRAELVSAKAEVENLKIQLEDAWEIAEDMAQEMDYMETFRLDDEFGGFGDFTESEFDDGASSAVDGMSVQMAEVIGITGRAVAANATLTTLASGLPAPRLGTADTPEAQPIQQGDHVRRVSSARTRSERASKASLKPPSRKPSNAAELAARASLRRTLSKRSRSRSRANSRGVGLPLIQVDAGDTNVNSFLEMGTRPTTPAASVTSATSEASSVPPVPEVPDLSNLHAASGLKRDSVGALRGPRDSMISTLMPSPGLDLTFLPADTTGDPQVRRSRSDSFGRRAQSMQLPPRLPTAESRPLSEPPREKAKRFSVPIRRDEAAEDTQPRPAPAAAEDR